MAKLNLPNNPTSTDNLTGEYTKLNQLAMTYPRTTSGNIAPWTSTTSGISYDMSTYASGAYANMGEQGLLLVLQDALKNYILTAGDFNSANATQGDLTYYVDTTLGSDSNTGLSSGAGAFKTIQYAIDKVPQIINHTVTINVAAGSYAEDVTAKGFNGKGSLNIIGGASYAASANFNVTAFHMTQCEVYVRISGFRATLTGTGTCFGFSYCNFGVVRWCSTSTAGDVGYQATGGMLWVVESSASNKTYATVSQYGAVVFAQNNTTGTGNTVSHFAQLSGKLVLSGTSIGSINAISTGGQVVAEDGTLLFPSGSSIKDINGNELIKFPSTVGSAVNEITISNSATGATPSISATGSDANISLNLVSKGTGTVLVNGGVIPKSDSVTTGVDINTVINSGMYRLNSGHANLPTEAAYGQLLVIHGGADTITQIVSSYSTGQLWTRSGNPTNVGGAGVWTGWRQMLPTVSTSDPSGGNDGDTWYQYV